MRLFVNGGRRAYRVSAWETAERSWWDSNDQWFQGAARRCGFWLILTATSRLQPIRSPDSLQSFNSLCSLNTPPDTWGKKLLIIFTIEHCGMVWRLYCFLFCPYRRKSQKSPAVITIFVIIRVLSKWSCRLKFYFFCSCNIQCKYGYVHYVSPHLHPLYVYIVYVLYEVVYGTLHRRVNACTCSWVVLGIDLSNSLWA